jgi:hypothetical protein
VIWQAARIFAWDDALTVCKQVLKWPRSNRHTNTGLYLMSQRLR